MKDVLLLLGAGVFLTAAMVMPGIPLLAKPFLDEKRRKEANEWKKFNTWRLRAMLRKMYDRKIVEIGEENGVGIVRLAEQGRKKFLKYDLESMSVDMKKWDGKWRLIVYDIFSKKQSERKLFHRTLKRMKFLQLQRSVYLTPYPCHDEIEYLRQVCGIGKEVLILIVKNIEHEEVYREYFGLE